jgi:hypothetical protein
MQAWVAWCARQDAAPSSAFRYSVVMSYQPMRLAELARFIAAEPDFDTQWRLVVEFLKEYHRAGLEEAFRRLARRGVVADLHVFSLFRRRWASATGVDQRSGHAAAGNP